ncbi:ClpP/crotonase-like domain-containing protein [Hyaloraphidium curvatum]|nr:ClpP/crotonase-like domain-containing protein [Hyaloraphidium curvatum]
MSAEPRVSQIASHLSSGPAAASDGLPTLELSPTGVATITLRDSRRRNPLGFAVLEKLEKLLLSLNPSWKYSHDWVGLDGLPDVPTGRDLDREGDFGERLGRLGVNPAVGVVVIRAEGPIFSSGHDLKEFVRPDPEFQAKLFAQCQRTMLLVRRLPQPVIAVLDKDQRVTAAGLQLVSMCDMILAHSSSFFQYSGVNIRMWCTTPQIPNAHPSRSVAASYTLKLLLTGEWSPAREAKEAGLVSEVFEDPARVTEIVEALASRNREAVVLGKWSFWKVNGGAGKEFEAQFSEITKLVLNMQKMNSVKAGSQAFLDKKK